MVAGEVMEQDAHLIRNEADGVVREPGQDLQETRS
jgi:hypothetical protein